MHKNSDNDMGNDQNSKSENQENIDGDGLKQERMKPFRIRQKSENFDGGISVPLPSQPSPHHQTCQDDQTEQSGQSISPSAPKNINDALKLVAAGSPSIIVVGIDDNNFSFVQNLSFAESIGLLSIHIDAIKSKAILK